jgi:hypothetical protein
MPIVASVQTGIRVIIIDFLAQTDSLKPISLVNHGLRQLSVPTLFRELTFEFTKAGLDRLSRAPRLSIARHVGTVCYKAPNLIDPGKLNGKCRVSLPSLTVSSDLRHQSTFEARYTPEQYVRDQQESRWKVNGQEITYSAICSNFRRRAEEQQTIFRSKLWYSQSLQGSSTLCNGCLAGIICNCDIDPFLDEKPGYLKITILSSDMKRHPHIIKLDMYISIMLSQNLDYFNIAILSSCIKRCPPILWLDIHIGTLLNQRLDLFQYGRSQRLHEVVSAYP